MENEGSSTIAWKSLNGIENNYVQLSTYDFKRLTTKVILSILSASFGSVGSSSRCANLHFTIIIINPRRACAERVTVVVLCVCMSVTHTLFWQYARLKV